MAPKGGSVFTREALGAIEELTEALWRVPKSIRVDSLTNYNHSQAVGDDLSVERHVGCGKSVLQRLESGELRIVFAEHDAVIVRDGDEERADSRD